LLLLILVLLLLSNRGDVKLAFWPFFNASLPLGMVLVALPMLGFLAGLIFHMPTRLGATRRAKKAEKRNAELEARLAAPPSP
jgi:uncharacterized integral membrane protein